MRAHGGLKAIAGNRLNPKEGGGRGYGELLTGGGVEGTERSLFSNLSHCVQELKQYASSLVSSRKLGTLHGALAAYSLEDMLQYYRVRPELAAYTIEQELPRISYAVRTRDGRLLRG